MSDTKDTYATALSKYGYGYPILVRCYDTYEAYRLKRNYREITIHPDEATALLAYTKAKEKAKVEEKAKIEAWRKSVSLARSREKARAAEAKAVEAKAMKAKAKFEREIDLKIFKLKDLKDIFRLYILDERYDKIEEKWDRHHIEKWVRHHIYYYRLSKWQNKKANKLANCVKENKKMILSDDILPKLPKWVKVLYELNKQDYKLDINTSVIQNFLHYLAKAVHNRNERRLNKNNSILHKNSTCKNAEYLIINKVINHT